MAVSHSFAGEHIEDRNDEKADAERDHHDIEHSGFAPFEPIRSDTRLARRNRVGTARPIEDPAGVKIPDGSEPYEIKNA